MKTIKPFVTLTEAKKQSNKIAKAAWKDIKNNLTEKGIKKLGKVPTINWKKHGFQTAGITTVFNGKAENDYIDMNINYLYSKDAKDFVKFTILHEIAHVIQHRLFNECGHNKQWKSIARMIGDSGDRCHNYSIPINKPCRKVA